MITVNEYFNGNVKSLGFASASGKATIGVMLPGSYTFSTSQKEKMVITSGNLQVKLPGEDWKTVEAGRDFEIAANQSFDVSLEADVSYLCYYY